MSDYTPNELDFIDTYVSAMSGGCTPNEDPERAKEAKRGIDKIKADALREAGAAVMGERFETETEAGNWLDERAERIEGEA